jgi:hypothetical protein
MGGFGSGERLKKKTTVGRCLELDAGRFSKAASMNFGLLSMGELVWTRSRHGRNLSLRYWLEPKAKDLAVLRITTLLDAHGNEPVLEYIHLKGTIPNFGGVRWWFICPLLNAEVPCNRRVKKLYFPPGGQYFGCRACFDLTYESAQTHDTHVDKLMRDPFALIQAIQSEDPVQNLRSFRAYARLQGWT